MLQNFIDYLEFERRYSQNTVIAYKKDILQFSEYLQGIYQVQLIEADQMHIRGWLVYLKDKKASNKTIQRKVSSLSSFYIFCAKCGELKGSPTKGIKLPKVEKRLPEFVKQRELEELVSDEYDATNFSEVRDRMIFILLCATGMRRSELITLKEVDVQNEVIKVLGKGNKERLVPLNEFVLNEIEDYLKLKYDCFGKVIDFFFVTDRGEKLYEKFVYRIINRYLSDASSMKKRSPHVLRHTFATHLLNNGADLNSIKELLGHSSLASTQIYTHNSMEQLKQIYKSTHPRSQK